MPPTQSDEPYENVAVGVKDLFETYENALLPVDVQLQKFKRRDLYTSHFHRTSCKVFGPRKHVRKVHFVDGNPFDQENKEDSFDDKAAGDIVLPSYYAKLKPLKEKQKVQEDSVIHSEVQDHKSWVEKRKKLRSDLNQLGLDAAWLKRKPERTALEECVLNRLLNESGQEKALNKSLPPSPSEKNLRLLPVNVKCILKQLGRYMKANNFLATDIFPTDDMTISSEACREGLDTMVKMDYINKSEANVIQKYFYDKGSPMSLFKALNLVTKRTKRQSSAVSAISEEKQESEEIPESPVYRKSKDQKQLRLLEYEMAVQLCEEQGIVLSETLLRKALLIPDDLPRSTKIRTKLRQPGECLQSDFWKAQHKSTLRRRKKMYKVQTQSSGSYTNKFASQMEDSDTSFDSTSSEQTPDLAEQSLSTITSSNEQSPKHSTDTFTTGSVLSEDTVNISSKVSKLSQGDSMEDESISSESDEQLEFGIQCSATSRKGFSNETSYTSNASSQKHRQIRFLPRVQKRKTSPTTTSEGLSSGRRTPSDVNLITFPRLRDVAPERFQMNLSTGRATISRKVDCWLTYEEYERLTCSADPVLHREPAVPNAFWPGHLLDKLRLCFSPCDTHRPPKCDRARSKNPVFHNVRQMPHNGRRSNYGYDNNLLTWPNDGKYIKYGSVDQDKVYHL